MPKLAIVLTLLTAVCAGFIPASAGERALFNPDFTGTWNARILHAGESATSLKISHQNPKLRISRISKSSPRRSFLGQSLPSSYTDEFVYYTDGRGEKNRVLFYVGPIGTGEMKSKSEVVGQKFVITGSQHSLQSGRQINIVIKYVFEVASDGGTLNLATTIVSEGAGTQTLESYERIEGNKTNGIDGRWLKKPETSIVSLVISHRDPEIKISRRVLSQSGERTESYIYYTDGRGETNLEEGREVKSTTKWDGESLVVSVKTASRVDGDEFRYWRTVKWQVSGDGKRLTEITRINLGTSNGIVLPGLAETKVSFARSSNELPRSIS